jgi:hypothetical protein
MPGVEYDFRVLAGDDDGYPAYMERLFTWKPVVLPSQTVDPDRLSPVHFAVEKIDATSARVCSSRDVTVKASNLLLNGNMAVFFFII